jgi:ubiquitin conjugation factor E4 A
VDKTQQASGYAPLTVGNFELPAKNKISDLMKSVPEFILENIVEYLQFSRHRESPAIQNLSNYEAQSSLFTFILLLMGSADRVKNPHLRFKIASCHKKNLPNVTFSTEQDWLMD